MNIHLCNRIFGQLQEAVHWMDYVFATDGARFLRVPLRDMNVFSRFNLDVYALLLAVLFGVVVVAFKAVRACCRCVFRGSRTSAAAQQKNKAD